MSVLRITPMPIGPPIIRVRGSGPTVDSDGEYVTIPSETVVLVALDVEQAGNIIDERRSASWICSLTERLSDLVDDGAFAIERDWEVSGTASVSISISGTVTAETADDARSQFSDLVRQDIDSYTQWDDADVDDVSIDHTERS